MSATDTQAGPHAIGRDETEAVATGLSPHTGLDHLAYGCADQPEPPWSSAPNLSYPAEAERLTPQRRGWSEAWVIAVTVLCGCLFAAIIGAVIGTADTHPDRAPAPARDREYLHALADVWESGSNSHQWVSSEKIEIGHQVCGKLADGSTREGVFDYLAGQRAGTGPDTWNAVIDAAVHAYCPQAVVTTTTAEAVVDKGNTQYLGALRSRGVRGVTILDAPQAVVEGHWACGDFEQPGEPNRRFVVRDLSMGHRLGVEAASPYAAADAIVSAAVLAYCPQFANR